MLVGQTLHTLASPENLIYLGICFVVYYAAWVVYARFFHPLSKFPGPFIASLTNWWYWRSVRYGISENNHLPLHKKYGPVVRIAPNEVSISDSRALEVVYGPKPTWNKTDFYDPFKPPVDRVEIFSSTDNALSIEKRRITASVYSQAAMLEYEPKINGIVSVFLQRLQDAAQSQTPIDLAYATRCYALDIIGEIFFGQEGGWNCLRDLKDHDNWLGTMETLVPPLGSAGCVPKGFQMLFIFSQLLSSTNRSCFTSFADIVSTSQAIVKNRRAEMLSGKLGQKNDILARLMAIVDGKGPEVDYTDGDVAMNVYGAIMAGSETTGIALAHLLYLVIADKRVYKKLTAEIREAFVNRQLTLPVRYTDAIRLPYWNACVKESERISPVGGVGLPREIPAGGVTLPGGQYLPGGYKVHMAAVVVNADRACYGDDAEQFKPERWIENDSETLKRMERRMFSFGMGPRVCQGKHLAMLEIYKLGPALLRDYDFELLDEPILEEYWFRRRSDINVRVTKVN